MFGIYFIYDDGLPGFSLFFFFFFRLLFSWVRLKIIFVYSQVSQIKNYRKKLRQFEVIFEIIIVEYVVFFCIRTM